MAYNNSLASLNTYKLIKRRDLFKGVIIGFGILWLAVFALATYFLIAKHTDKLFIPLVILLIHAAFYYSMEHVKQRTQ